MFRNKYKHLFFDLDRTLWDFDASSYQTFVYMYEKYNLKSIGIQSLDEFTEVYHKHNDHFWDLYRNGEITKDLLRGIRFQATFDTFGIDNKTLVGQITEDYLYHSPRNVFLFPNAHKTLDYLRDRVELHMITNGFEEVQEIKMQSSDLRKYFKTVVTSEEAGVKKPDARIFEYALKRAGATADESIMIGDDLEVDIEGARLIGMDTVYFNPAKLPHPGNATYEISDLADLCNYF
ncbi:MAG: noncanonical pyrimidine nucleotidase, YjjG family [Bacteroidales bacterium]|nr:noncanonical pyrimidine nucleotidase, YjjG family [Bacteroidales bacterium]